PVAGDAAGGSGPPLTTVVAVGRAGFLALPGGDRAVSLSLVPVDPAAPASDLFALTDPPCGFAGP
ncbi:MAG: hypothetical protein M3462_07880, partial [Chloroflexota bacterium]|nr:hypothetical protein [Chloroflexota bacterium]